MTLLELNRCIGMPIYIGRYDKLLTGLIKIMIKKKSKKSNFFDLKHIFLFL